MIPVFQTLLREGRAPNCFSACMASILERRLEELPHFEAFGEGKWFDVVQRWLGACGLALLTARFPEGQLPDWTPCPAWVIVGGTSATESLHCVVGRTTRDAAGVRLEFAHDPFPWPKLKALDPRGVVEKIHAEVLRAGMLQGSLADWTLYWFACLDPAQAEAHHNEDVRAAIAGAARG